MATVTPAQSSILDQRLKDNPPAKWGVAIFVLVLMGGLIYIIWRLSVDLSPVHQGSVFPYVLLGVALLIALGFEFVNGFHDTANAVATVIYTHSLEPHVAVVWSALWNFVGVITSSGAVAFSIVSLLPVELILRVSKGSGFSMIFALLVASVLWNLATWRRGRFLDKSTKYIPSWVKVAVALAVGLGTMVGWKRIVVTVGEKIGKTHLTYAQGASAELVAMTTILGADGFGLPVSTTHVLSSGVAGTMAANGSGLQMATLRNIAIAWVFTLPAAAVLAGVLFSIFNLIAR
jgi:phosphate/sulfate permease